MSNKVINIPEETSNEIDDIRFDLEGKLGTTLSQRQVIQMIISWYIEMKKRPVSKPEMEVLKNGTG